VHDLLDNSDYNAQCTVVVLTTRIISALDRMSDKRYM